MVSGSGWNLWVWLAGGCGWNLWVWLYSRYGCKEIYRFLILLILYLFFFVHF